ncbi:MAG: hypothetical protein Q8L52_03820 [bacterium]|nr:hypothetical protein [bacterium]
MRETTVIEKLIPSVVNAMIAIVTATPVYIAFGPGLGKSSAILVFYLMQILDTHENSRFRCFGMRVFGTVWKKNYSRTQRNVYSILYTLSFATLFFHIYFPFDLFVINMLFVQVPTIILTGTTFHGFLAGGMRSQKKIA